MGINCIGHVQIVNDDQVWCTIFCFLVIAKENSSLLINYIIAIRLYARAKTFLNSHRYIYLFSRGSSIFMYLCLSMYTVCSLRILTIGDNFCFVCPKWIYARQQKLFIENFAKNVFWLYIDYILNGLHSITHWIILAQHGNENALQYELRTRKKSIKKIKEIWQ